MRTDSPPVLANTEINAVALYAALEELHPRRRAVWILFVWKALQPGQIATYMAAQGISVDIATVERYLVEATRHCYRRLVEAVSGG